MKIIGAGDGDGAELFYLVDPDAQSETEFEARVVMATCRFFRRYECVVFGGGFQYEGRVNRPDLALVAHDRSHWFVIEVELVSHSLWGHVLPQVRAFQYGRPMPDCAGILARELGMPHGEARTLVELVPRSTAVIANRREPGWEGPLRAVNVQLVTLSVFAAASGAQVMSIDGVLEVVSESLGFGVYVAADRSLRFPAGLRVPDGVIQIDDAAGSLGAWGVKRESRATWLTKETGAPAIPDGSHIQLIRTVDGRISLKRPT